MDYGFRVVPGDVLRGKYRVERVLGEGGMGVVVRAKHLRLDQVVAIKMLRDNAAASSNVAMRFAREARAAARLKGEHCVRVLDVDDEGGAPFLVMEHLDGLDLDRLVRKDGPLDVARAASYLLQACEGLAEAHALGIVHRDVKPANLFLAKRPRGGEIVKILDFGISTAPDDDDPTITVGERVLGSPSFMAPEQLKSAHDVDARADVWALGVVLYWLLSGRLPFPGDSATAVAAKIAADPPVPLEGVPADVAAVVATCLAKDKNERYATVADVARALAPFAEDGADVARRVSSVLRIPVAEPKAPSSSTTPAAGPVTASVDAVPAPPALVTASLDAPGPVSVGILEAAETRDDPAAKRPFPIVAVAAAIAVVLAGGAVIYATRAPAAAPITSSTPPPPPTPVPPPMIEPSASISVAAPVTPPPSASASAPRPRAVRPPVRPTSSSLPRGDDPLKLDLK